MLRSIRWLACLTVALVVTTSQPVAAQSPYANITEKQVEDYLQAFWTLTIWFSGQEPGAPGEPRARSLWKISDVIRVHILGEEEFALQKLRQVATWTGLKLVVLSSGDATENLLIEFRDDPFKSPLSTRPRCQTIGDKNARGDFRVHVFIDPGRVRSCFVHELGHALGFNHAHDVDSVMSYTHRPNEFTGTDILMLRVLYDRRLRPEMRALPAMVAARAALVEKLIEGGAPARTANMGWPFLQNLVPFLTDMAEKGNVSAQRELGFAYTFGDAAEIVPQDAATGHRWFARAAEKDDAQAQANLGYDLLHGKGIAANSAEGLRLLRLAAERGHAGAQHELGIAYTFGRGVPKDEATGYTWLVRSAEGGDVRAQTDVAIGLLYGRGVSPNPAEGIRRLRLAADQGYAAAQYELGRAYTSGKGVAKDEAAGYAWFRRAAEAGQVNAQSAVGYALLHGRGVAADPKEGIRWLRTAADRNLPAAQDFLGQAYRDGLGVSRDPVEAYKWFALATAKKLDRAQENLVQLAPTLTAAQIAEGEGRAEAWRPGQ